MQRILRIVAVVAACFALPALAQSAATGSGISDLAYSVQRGNSLYFTGNYEGKPVNLVRDGVMGSGKWTIYTGTLTNRVRLTVDDRKGLQEVLAMDQGHRMTLNAVGGERIEYRLYAPDRSFVIGSVLYRNDKRWMLGVMKTEAFSGYQALSDVSDVTEKLGAQSALPAGTFAGWLQGWWQGLHLFPTASAEDLDSLITQVFSERAQDARRFFTAPAHEMFKASLAGAAAFSVKLAAQTLTGGEAITVAGAVAAAMPFVAAVAVGVGIGLAADATYDWARAKKLTGTTSAGELYNRLVAGSRFSNEPTPEVPPQMMASPSNFRNLVQEADDEEKRHKLELHKALSRAEECKDMACANVAFEDASKFAHGSGDRKLIFAARETAEVRTGLIRADEEIAKGNSAKEKIARDEKIDQAVRAAVAAHEQKQAAQRQAEQGQVIDALFGAAATMIGSGSGGSAQTPSPARQGSAIQSAPQARQKQSLPKTDAPMKFGPPPTIRRPNVTLP